MKRSKEIAALAIVFFVTQWLAAQGQPAKMSAEPCFNGAGIVGSFAGSPLAYSFAVLGQAPIT